MNKYKQKKWKPNEERMIKDADECLERFGRAFNNEDREGMDDECHFPHILLFGNKQVTWEAPGQVPELFFESLKTAGWHSTTCEKAEPILISDDKIHYLWSYSRRNALGEVLTFHENLWILILKDGKWGISLRSY